VLEVKNRVQVRANWMYTDDESWIPLFPSLEDCEISGGSMRQGKGVIRYGLYCVKPASSVFRPGALWDVSESLMTRAIQDVGHDVKQSILKYNIPNNNQILIRRLGFIGHAH